MSATTDRRPPAGVPRDGAGRLAPTLTRRVRALREAAGRTRAELSQRSGVSIAYLARLEAGRANVSLQVIERIAHALDVAPLALLADAGPGSADAARIAALVARLSPAERDDAWRLLHERFGGATVPVRPARRIALIGLRGAGKSTLGERLASVLGVPFVELNREIERAGGVAVPEVFTLYGAAGYRTLERSCLARVIERHDAVVLATGGGLVSDAGTYDLLRGAFRTVWLRAQPHEHFDRVRRQQDARIAAPALEAAAMANIRAMLAARDPLYALADLTLRTSGRTPAQSLRDLVALLGVAPARAAGRR